jgi:hypothetical protein
LTKPVSGDKEKHCGGVAQSVEQGTENPRVGGSIPSPATSNFSHLAFQNPSREPLRVEGGCRQAYRKKNLVGLIFFLDKCFTNIYF